MPRLALFIFALFASVVLTFASPAPIINGELIEMEKRVEHDGRGTWYYPGMGNCGDEDDNDSLVIAIGIGLYDSNGGGYCNQWVGITFNGVTVFALIRDSCQACGNNDIDMSPAVFKQLASLDTGEIQVEWHFMGQSWAP